MVALKARRYTAEGKKEKDRELPGILFDGEVNENALHRAVKAHLAARRQGTSSTKSRGEVRGGSRKPWRQKGTGRARHGTIRSPIWEGGAITFGPKPKSHRQGIPRKVKQVARRSALNDRAADDRLVLVDPLDFEVPKTKRLRELFEAMELEGKVLLLTDGLKEEVYLSARNMPHVEVRPFGEESAYDLLWARVIVVEEPAVERAAEEAEAAAAEAAEKAKLKARVRPEPEVVEEAPPADVEEEPAAAGVEEPAPEEAEEEPGAADEEEAPAEPAGAAPLPEDFPGHRPFTEAGIETVEEVRALDDVKEIKGIGPKTAEKIREALAALDEEDGDA